MATISTSGISTQQIIRSEHILRIINALNGVNANDIIITGPLNNGLSCIATGSYSHAEGLGTIASGDYQHAQGAYNISSSLPSSFIIGNGTSAGNRSNLVFASGSTFQITGSLQVLGSITGSLFGTATTASYVQNAQSASYVLQAVSASFVVSASRAVSASYAVSASFVVSSSRAVTASYALNGGPIAVTGSILYSTSPAAGPGFGVSTADSIFLGFLAGGSTNVAYSTFLGYQTGQNAYSANNSNFFGQSAGINAINANNSNFLGASAGFGASSASYSNFLGNAAGYQSVSASYSTLIGYQAGYNTIGSIGSNNIIIGTNITLAAQQKDSINLGGIIFATGSYSTTSGNPFSGSVSGAKVGIGTSTPSYTLDISGSTRINDILILEPRTTTPGTPTNGMVIVSGSGANQHIYCYLNSIWKQLD